MARKSSIDRLPKSIKKKLQELLSDPSVIQLEVTKQINELLEQKGHEERVSKSSVNRFAMRMEKVGARLKQSREVAEVWIGKLGATPQGEVGKLLNELIRTLAFETTMNLAEDKGHVDPKMLSQLALAVQRLEASATDNLKRDAEIKRQAQEEAAETAEKIAKQGGASLETIENIKAGILGVVRS